MWDIEDEEEFEQDDAVPGDGGMAGATASRPVGGDSPRTGLRKIKNTFRPVKKKRYVFQDDGEDDV